MMRSYYDVLLDVGVDIYLFRGGLQPHPLVT